MSSIVRGNDLLDSAKVVQKDVNGNVGIGVTPSAWNAATKSIDVTDGTSIVSKGQYIVNGGTNHYYNAAGQYIYISNGYATKFSHEAGSYIWKTAPSGTAGNAITWTNAMTLSASGDLIIGTNNQISGVLLTTGGGASVTYSASYLGKNTASGRSVNAGGTINASGADYAEYEYSNDITITKGQIVGFKADGTLTDKYSESIRFAIKSTNPSIVGGDTWGIEEIVGKRPEQPIKTEEMTDEEFTALEDQYKLDLVDFEAILEVERQKVDRIAYAGKVPVNVLGAIAGDYIIVVNKDNNIDGEAISNPTFEQYLKCVGRVNKILEDGRAEVAVLIH